MPPLNDLRARAAAFEAEAHALFGQIESARSRVIQLDESYRKLGLLNLKQDELMRQALRCAEQGLYRAAHVMAWAAFMDFYEDLLASDGMVALRAARPGWTHVASMEELREYQAEFGLLELAQPLHLATKNETRALQSMLNKRNQCAHPSSFTPDLNSTLGYMSEVLHYLTLLAGKTPH
ncbi:hypothetical protein GCM10022286_26800 [Gryllotalpicola daejeonensis]|uniref:RiboL-PSP-HEPN domain-containing protein n=1 Tax=Gryllotalpicola daejeonensis TaxID=993087 RepID=A0ABP7ZMM2_9MICO